jgi:tetratricopeptide (TPR) repeat protein
VTDHLTHDSDYLNALMHLNLAEKCISSSASKKSVKAKADELEFFDLVKAISDEIRKLEYGTITEYQNQIWEISGNLLFAFEELQNSGIERLKNGYRESALEHFQKANELYEQFVDLNQKLSAIKSPKATKTQKAQRKVKKSKGIVGKLGVLVQKVIDCCIE